MSTEENKAVIRRFMEAGNKQDMEAIWECIDPQCTFPVLTRFGLAPTFEVYQKFLTSYFQSLPDVHFTIEEMVAEGEQVWARITIRGTHRGPLRNIPSVLRKMSAAAPRSEAARW